VVSIATARLQKVNYTVLAAQFRDERERRITVSGEVVRSGDCPGWIEEKSMKT
jgi:hypothetical protein